MSPPTSKPLEKRPKLVLRRLADRPALPVVRPPPRPSYASLESIRPQASSVPPVAATWPPPAGDERPLARAMASRRSLPILIASGVALCGAMIAATAGFVVVPRSPTKPVATVHGHTGEPRAVARASPPAAGSTRNTSPWIEVPTQAPLVTPAAVPASDLPVARAVPVPRPLPRAAPGPLAASVSSGPAPVVSPRASAAPVESARVPVLPGTASSASARAAAPVPVDPVLKAVEDEIDPTPAPRPLSNTSRSSLAPEP
jgi:hypothetical protein